MIKGTLHVHSNYSYDGKNGLSEICEWAKKIGLRFIIFSEHDRTFDASIFEKFCAQCHELCTPELILIPGIEYSIGKTGEIHVTVFGISTYIEKKSLKGFLDDVHERGGAAILNHPYNVRKIIDAPVFDKFDFIEVWNTKYDFSYAPYRTLFKIAKKHKLKAVISSDIHEFPPLTYSEICILSDSCDLNEKALIANLRSQNYLCKYKDWTIDQNSDILHFSFKKRVLILYPYFHRHSYNILRKIARRCGYKPSTNLVKILRLKKKDNDNKK